MQKIQMERIHKNKSMNIECINRHTFIFYMVFLLAMWIVWQFYSNDIIIKFANQLLYINF